MEMRRTGILPAAALSCLCLAVALGCTSKKRYASPDVASFSPGQGAVGSPVVITGQYFSGVSWVNFGGANTTDFQTNSQNQITATVPPNAATGPIVVENPAGVGTSYTSFIVTPQIAQLTNMLGYPSYASGLSQIQGPASGTLNVTGYGLNDVTAVTVGGNTCSFTLDSANMVLVNLANAATGPVVVSVLGPNETTLTATSAVNYTVVNP